MYAAICRNLEYTPRYTHLNLIWFNLPVVIRDRVNVENSYIWIVWFHCCLLCLCAYLRIALNAHSISNINEYDKEIQRTPTPGGETS